MKDLTLIVPYYDSPDMFQVQQENWMSYPEKIRDRMEFIVVDDCSQELYARDNVIFPPGFPFRLFFITEHMLWNWEAARNIGAKHAEGKWLFLTDMDHLLPPKSCGKIFDRIDNGLSVNKPMEERFFYTVDRVNAPDLTMYKNHPNTYLLTRELYWYIGGYDEEFNIITGGIYGMDGPFRRWAEKMTDGNIHLDGIPIVRYPREIVADASCTLPRKTGRNEADLKAVRALARRKMVKEIMPTVLKSSYTEEKWE